MSKIMNKMLKRKKSITKNNKPLEIVHNTHDVYQNVEDEQSFSNTAVQINSDESYGRDYYCYSAKTNYNLQDYSESIKTVSTNSIVRDRISVYENRNNFKSQDKFVCQYCNGNQNGTNLNFIILSCNHIYHVKCLADRDHSESKDYRIMDDGFFENRKCDCCQTTIEKSELIMIHTKFFKGTAENIKKHDENIIRLENQIKNLQEDLKTSIEYKQRLEYEREKSKQITSVLNTMLLS